MAVHIPELSSTRIRAIEEATLNAWPALQQMVYDGWLLRFANGYTGRANSINPVYAGSLPAVEKIGACERLYRARGLPANFRITPLVPPDLEPVLEDQGYVARSLTSVQCLELDSKMPSQNGLTPAEMQAWERPSRPWLQACINLNEVPAHAVPILWGILNNIVTPSRYLLLCRENQPIACGLAVVEERYAGLYKIATHPAQRGRGYGSQLVLSLLAWAKDQGARLAYLQVTAENAAAQRLYTRLGFVEFYRYWYRTQQGV
jgi:N-acetylglutamate synthase